jgi:hypothetical protein
MVSDSGVLGDEGWGGTIARECNAGITLQCACVYGDQSPIPGDHTPPPHRGAPLVPAPRILASCLSILEFDLRSSRRCKSRDLGRGTKIVGVCQVAPDFACGLPLELQLRFRVVRTKGATSGEVGPNGNPMANAKAERPLWL